jgi:hypothetical protein
MIGWQEDGQAGSAVSGDEAAAEQSRPTGTPRPTRSRLESLWGCVLVACIPAAALLTYLMFRARRDFTVVHIFILFFTLALLVILAKRWRRMNREAYM